ncbi:MAG: tetratricopeptide repeat protein [Spirochaetales bacterium]|nr:tetratricopeptide repeat protein [Spirochaetales bacterium]MCF7937112.1 tetratricopeptide repeat protein [Spirochaetales bacterium]
MNISDLIGRKMVRNLTFLLIISVLLFSCVSSIRREDLAPEFFNMGNAYYEVGRFEKAGEYYKKALEYDPGLYRAGFNLARAYIELEMYQDAEDILRELLDEDPDNTKLLETLAYNHLQQDQSLQAYRYYLLVLKQSPYHERALYNLGRILQYRDQPELAYEYFRRLYEIDPEDEEASLALGSVLLDLGKSEEGLAFLEQYLEENPEDIETAQTLLSVYEKQEYYADAVRMLNILQKLDPENPEYPFHKAVIQLLAMEDIEAGLESLQQAFDLGFEEKERLRPLVADADVLGHEQIVSFLEEHDMRPQSPGSPAINN